METIGNNQNELQRFYNFSMEAMPLSYGSAFASIESFLTKANLSFAKSRYPYYSHDLTKDTKAFFDNYFTLYDILYLPEANLLPLTYAGRENDQNKVQNVLLGIKKYCTQISPFELPINKTVASPFYGEVDKRLFVYKDEEEISKIPVIFTGISLGYPFTNISPAVYAHEITHSQVFNNKHVLQSPDYVEVLSIFMEKLCALEKDPEFFREIERRRCSSLLSSLRKLKTGQISQSESGYIIATLIAEKLFNTYIYGSINDQVRIINKINEIFEGLCPISDLISMGDASFKDNCNENALAKNLSL